MKHILFFLTFSLIFFLGQHNLYAQIVKPCITVNGQNPSPGNASGAPKYFNKCAKRTVKLAVKNCGTGIVDPSEFTYSWVNTTSGSFTYTSPEVDTDEPGLWVVTVSYTDPIFGTTYTDKDTLNLVNYAAVTPALVINNNAAVLAHCSYESVTFQATVGNQFITGSYKWFINNTATQDTTVSPAGTGPTLTTVIPAVKWVTVIATDINGCRNSDNIYSPLQSSPAAPNLGADRSKCPGASTTLTTAYNASYSYYWNGSTSGASGANANNFIAASPGKYWVSVSGGTLSPCRIADTILISDYNAPTADIGTDTSVCYHATGPMHVNATGSGSLTYSWTPTTYFASSNPNSANPTIDFSGSGLGTFPISVLVTDGNSCTITKTKNVTHLGQGSNPYMNVIADPLDICTGTTKQFVTTATTTYPTTLTYEWTPATHLSSGSIKQPTVDLSGEALSTPFNYSLKVSDSKGCYLTITTSATLVPSVVANVGFTDSSLCVGNTITLLSSGTGGTGSLTYTWSPSTDLSDPAIPNPVTTPTENRLYTITISDSKGCQDSKTVDIKAIDMIVKLFATDTSGYAIEPMVLNPYANSNTYTYQWTNVTTSTTLGTTKSQLAEESATYAVYATEPASGCHVSDTINVTLQVGNPRLLYVPNVVNPASANADNKTVKVYGTAVLEDDFTFRIYNKWGEMIYETTSFNDANTNGWNGVYKSANGTEQNLSVYTYSLHGRYFDGQEFDKTGSITLMR